jgi:putative isomerase
MLRDTTIPSVRAWNTWSHRPAEMVFLPLGVRVTPIAYSDHLRSATLFPPGAGVRFGAHAIDGSHVSIGLSHGGTQLAWTWAKPDPFELIGQWRTETSGEWGLRFWLTLCLSAEGGEVVRLVDDAATVKVGARYVALAAGSEPVLVTGHARIEDVAADYETNGYFNLSTRADEAAVLALRFNLEMMRDGKIAAAVADDLARAIAQAKSRASAPDAVRAASLPSHTGYHAGALDAIRDVMAWNSVYDKVNARPYTAISRNWSLQKFGGFGVWLDDQFYHALLSGLFDAEVARENLATALANATPQGNLACLVTARDAWVDRTQIPIGSFIVRLLSERLADRSLVALAYEVLARNHAWWWENRDPMGKGLVSYGNSDVGEGLYKGTAFGARNESGMDNSPIHDEAEYDKATRTLTTIDVGLNSLLAWDAECLAVLAEAVGRVEQSTAHATRAEALRRRIRDELWDARRGIFANRLRDGRFVRSVGPTSFFPLICGAATSEQAERLLAHLDDPATFGGRLVLPSVSRDDPAFADNTYWRGRIWPPLNFIVWHGLRRYGYDVHASRLAEASMALFRQSWDDRRLCPENYNADTGEALDQPDTEGFYGWGALMPMLGVAEVMDVNPWGGWEVVNSSDPAKLGPAQTPAGPITLRREHGTLELYRDRSLLLATTVPGRITQIRIEPRFLELSLPGNLPQGCTVTVPSSAGRLVMLARLGTTSLTAGSEGVFRLPGGGTERQWLVIVWE